MFSYKWYLKDLPKIDKTTPTVFSCFSGGGGSSMGYKLAGFNVIGFNEIDKKQVDNYLMNFNCKYPYIEDIRIFRKRKNLPKELFNLDILDGSPPCTTFSMAGQREKTWGLKKKFNEGQKEQILDDLVFEYCYLGLRLQPKIILLENVTGIIKGNAIKYVAKIIKLLSTKYKCTWRICNAAYMGVPQIRNRFFLLALRKDFQNIISYSDLLKEKPFINLKFNQSKIPFFQIEEKNAKDSSIFLNKKSKMYQYWKNTKPGDRFSIALNKNIGFTNIKVHPNLVCSTVTVSPGLYHYNIPRVLSIRELLLVSSWPLDYKFQKQNVNYIKYIIGMSVPPVMMAQIALQIKKQWLNKINIQGGSK